MKKLILLFFCIFFTLINLFTVSAIEIGENSPKIEQIYTKLPEIKAYVRLDDSYMSNNIKGYMDSKELYLSNVKEFDRQEGITYIFMVDCSTSVTNTQITTIRSILKDFVKSNTYSNDKYIIVSFGETINVLADGENTLEEVISSIDSLKNNQLATVLFDAVSGVKQISDGMGDLYPDKRMCVVFTDAVDYTVGGTTQEELLTVAELTGVPLYTVAIDEHNKKSIDVIGQVSRKSGGEVFVAENGDIQNAFNNVIAQSSLIKELSFVAESNIVNNNASNLKIMLNGTASGENIEHKFIGNLWLVDNKQPFITDVKQISDKEICINFSESVKNAEFKENYIVKKGSQTYKLTSVLYDSSTHSVILHFDMSLGKGKYTIDFANITDNSMEKNTIKESCTFEISGFKSILVNIKNFFIQFWWIVAIFTFIIVTVIILSIIKKRKGIVLVNGKLTYADNIKYETVKSEPLPTHYIQLVMENSDGNITNLDINITQSIIFGRAETCEVTINDINLSRQHFAIEVDNSMLFIQNLSQTNGTILNGVNLQSRRKLELGDVIIAGQEKFTVKKI